MSETPRSLTRRQGDDQVAITWVGNATTLIEVGDLRLLTDPNFLHAGSHAALGAGLRTRRLHDPAWPIDDVLPVDAVILSHHHGDHWDHIADERIPKRTPVITTTQAARKLERRGFSRAIGLERWQAHRIERGATTCRVVALPGRHGPAILGRALPPVMGTMLDVEHAGRHCRIYVSGDTLVFDDLAEIPKRYPEVDLALVHLGGTRLLGVLLTMDGAQGARLLEIIEPEIAVPIHFEEYTIMKSPLSEFTGAVARSATTTRLRCLERGDTLHLALEPTR